MKLQYEIEKYVDDSYWITEDRGDMEDWLDFITIMGVVGCCVKEIKDGGVERIELTIGKDLY